MEDWTPKLKNYPHFDAPIPEDQIYEIVKDPSKVAQNAFMPFIVYEQKAMKFDREKKKPRPIRYACRRDSYIYSYYRSLLSQRYEGKLQEMGISAYPIAYRKIPVSEKSPSGKCNIHLAKEAFQKIIEMGNCFAAALDISQYFESLSHDKIYKKWCELLDCDDLPADHAAVFNNITKYRVVDLQKSYERLGLMGAIRINGIDKFGYLKSRDNIPVQLCSPKEFREKICGKGDIYTSLVQKNANNFGIPQGSPISDLIANFYLLDFDKNVGDHIEKFGGYYRRYSDDILIIIPQSSGNLQDIISYIKDQISFSGQQLKIKDEKTNIVKFTVSNGKISSECLVPQDKSRNFEYLGFSFDGNSIRLRDATVSRYYRKLTFGVRQVARNSIARYPDKAPSQILPLINIEKIIQKYGRIEDFDKCADYADWNFWTYAKRASTIMSPLPNGIMKQVANHQKKIKSLVESELTSQFVKAYKRKAAQVV